MSGDMKLSVAALVTAAAGIVLQILAGSELYPTIPPGPIVLLAGAVLMAVGPRTWTRYVATFVPVFLIVGGVIASVVSGAFLEQLTDVGEPGIFVGSVMYVVGVVTAFVAGIALWRGGAPAAR